MPNLYEILKLLHPTDDVVIDFWKKPGHRLPTYQVNQLLEDSLFEPELLNSLVISISPLNWHTVSIFVKCGGES